jgi:hypothetical protein
LPEYRATQVTAKRTLKLQLIKSFQMTEEKLFIIIKIIATIFNPPIHVPEMWCDSEG